MSWQPLRKFCFYQNVFNNHYSIFKYHTRSDLYFNYGKIHYHLSSEFLQCNQKCPLLQSCSSFKQNFEGRGGEGGKLFISKLWFFGSFHISYTFLLKEQQESLYFKVNSEIWSHCANETFIPNLHQVFRNFIDNRKFHLLENIPSPIDIFYCFGLISNGLVDLLCIQGNRKIVLKNTFFVITV